MLSTSVTAAIPSQGVASQAGRFVLSRRFNLRLLHICFFVGLGIAWNEIHAQTNTDQTKNPLESLFKGVGDFVSNIVAPKGQKLKELVDSQKYLEAAAYYEVEKIYFDAERKAFGDVLKALADALNGERIPDFRRQIEEIEGLGVTFSRSEDVWRRVRQVLSDAERSIADYDKIELLRIDRYRAPEVSKLDSARDRLKVLYLGNH